ncbi:hypothetical protein VNO77_01440 [Canavalia gladiata]|uniref:VQ domain-containing protein n=1 Tax=Canavalia gladiata TaxID=3824 RepID=A0AAN9R258_CANGL
MATGPKIVHIETRYVETDAINFRDVVQRLTGKNSSSTNWVPNADAAAAASSSLVAPSDHNKVGTAQHHGVSAKPQEDATATTDNGKKNSVLSSMLLMNMSFEDFDGLLSDFPSMEEFLLL